MKRIINCRVIALLLIWLFCFVAAEARTATDPQQSREIKMVARRFEFSPNKITVQKGERVRLSVTSQDVDHGIAVKEFGIDETVKAGQTKTVEFTADRAGRFEFTCSIFCGDGHPDMVGEILVTDGPGAQESNVKVSFDEGAQGVVIVESNGERLRIDTNTKTVTRLGAAATEPQPTSTTATSPSQERSRWSAREPYDYHIVNVPTPKRVPRGSLNFHLTHRFRQPVRPLEDSDDDLFGFDSSSVSSFGFTFGITDRLYANVYRSPVSEIGLTKTIEVGLGYHLLDEAGRSPIALSAYASAEGDDNFKRNFTFNFQAMIARSVTEYVNLFFSPAVHINSNGQGRFNPRVEDFGPVAESFEQGQHTGSFGFGVNGRITPSTSLLFEYTPRVGFKMGRVQPLLDFETGTIVGFEKQSEAAIGFGIEKRVGRHSFSLTFSNTQTTTTSRYNSSNLVLPPKRFTIGFNLFRRLM
jgi:cytochrome c oxidase subunit II